MVRASLYHYDFTRLDSPWAKANPGATVINATRGSKEHHLWWARTRVSEYIPPVDLKALKQIAEQQGWTSKEEPLPCPRPSKKKPETPWHHHLAHELKASLCQAVMWSRGGHGARLRKWVGFRQEVPLYGWLWAGASTDCFFDGPLITIAACIIIPQCAFGLWVTAIATLQRALSGSAAPVEKVKTE